MSEEGESDHLSKCFSCRQWNSACRLDISCPSRLGFQVCRPGIGRPGEENYVGDRKKVSGLFFVLFHLMGTTPSGAWMLLMQLGPHSQQCLGHNGRIRN